MALLSIALPTIIDSETKTFLFFAIVMASSIFLECCKISRVKIEIGVLAIKGILDFPAFMVTVKPSLFIPETAPIIPGQVTIINAWPSLGLMNATTLFSAKASFT